MHILLVDDDAELCSLLTEFLRREGFTVDCAHDGYKGLEMALKPGVDLVVLDVMLPGIDGFEILQAPAPAKQSAGNDADRPRRGCGSHHRARTGRRRLPPQAIQPARTGGAHPRHFAALCAASAVALEPRWKSTAWCLIPALARYSPTVSRWSSTTFEFDILELLMRSAGHVLSRDALMENLYNRKATPFDRSLDMHISHLRKKLENGDAIIKTIRGVGYQFARSPEDAGAE